MANRLRDLAKQRFGKLIAIKYIPSVNGSIAYWECLCDCGNTKLISSNSLTRGTTKSCGCLARELSSQRMFLDITDKVFNGWTVLKFSGIKYGQYFWECQCSCEYKTIKIINGSLLRSNKYKSCTCSIGKRSNRFKNISGKEFGYLKVLKFSHVKNRKAYWVCKCSRDGNEVISLGTDLKNGSVRSCGCLAEQNRLTHGFSNSRLYGIWCNIKARCTNPNTIQYADYGGRGIKLCPEWQTFEGFFSNEGESYYKHVDEFGERNTTADRWPDNDGNYEKGNFRWATMREQARGTRKFPKTENYDEHNYWRHKLGGVASTVLRKHRTSGRRWTKSNVFEKYVGLTKLEFCKYIESQFEPWMNWNNYGKGLGKWNLDHIKPCHEFDLSKEQDRLACFNYKNSRPYCAVKNNSEQRRELATI